MDCEKIKDMLRQVFKRLQKYKSNNSQQPTSTDIDLSSNSNNTESETTSWVPLEKNSFSVQKLKSPQEILKTELKLVTPGNLFPQSLELTDIDQQTEKFDEYSTSLSLSQQSAIPAPQQLSSLSEPQTEKLLPSNSQIEQKIKVQRNLQDYDESFDLNPVEHIQEASSFFTKQEVGHNFNYLCRCSSPTALKIATSDVHQTKRRGRKRKPIEYCIRCKNKIPKMTKKALENSNKTVKVTRLTSQKKDMAITKPRRYRRHNRTI